MAYNGTSIVDYLNSVGKASDFSSRAKLAAEKGIQGYTGTAEQNLSLLGMLNAPAPVVAPAPAPAPVPVTPPASQPQPAPQPIPSPAPAPVQQKGNIPTYTPASSASVPASTPVPATPVVPATPIAPATSSLTYQVKPGDTINAIATRLGVSPSQISGYRSGNSNLIYAGETLNVGGGIPTTVPAGGSSDAINNDQAQKEASVQKLVTQAAALGLDFPKEAIDAILGISVKTADQIQNEVYDKYGITDLQKKFATRPEQTWQEIYTAAFNSSGLSDVKKKIDDISQKLTDMENAANEDYANINDNPWHTEASRLGDMRRAQEKWTGKMKVYSDQLTLLQNTYDNGKDEAKNVATQAINTFNQNQQWDKNQLDMLTNKADAVIDAQLATQAEQKSSDVYRYYPEYMSSFTPKKTTTAANTPLTIKSGGAIFSGADVAKMQNQLEQSRGSDGYANSKLYTDALAAWQADGGISNDFFSKFPPKNFLNPGDSSLPTYIKDKLKQNDTTIIISPSDISAALNATD